MYRRTDPGDEGVVVDTSFHALDEELLRLLDVTDAPEDGRDLSVESRFSPFLNSCRRRYSSQQKLARSPRADYLDFTEKIGAGPVDVLEVLSDGAKVRYTEALLDLKGSSLRWTMWHTGSNRQEYPKTPYESLTTHMLLEHGRLRTPNGIVPLSSALGRHPTSPDALRFLLGHSRASELREAFGLIEPAPEIHGADDPIPLVDVWRGLDRVLPPHHRASELVRCERIFVIGQVRDCILYASAVYLADTVGDDDFRKVRLVTEQLGVRLSDAEVEEIIRQGTREEVEEQRTRVRMCSTDPERLLAAVGEAALRMRLPTSLLAVLENGGTRLTGHEVAEVAMATWHTGALKHVKSALQHLDPPLQWAGSSQTVEFVKSLGFSSEWAGDRERKRDAFVEVEGPRSLPTLHDYQRTVVDNIRGMLRGDPKQGGKRGIVSMAPRGPEKRRVAVQAVAEAIRDDGFRSGVLWVADRDELCEQAVESWRQVWASVGAEAVRLRISRLWAGLEKPMPTSRHHVVVATIQTLNARLSQRSEWIRISRGLRACGVRRGPPVCSAGASLR